MSGLMEELDSHICTLAFNLIHHTSCSIGKTHERMRVKKANPVLELQKQL